MCKRSKKLLIFKKLPVELTNETKILDFNKIELKRSSKNEIKKVELQPCLYNATNSSSIEATASDGEATSTSSIKQFSLEIN